MPAHKYTHMDACPTHARVYHTETGISKYCSSPVSAKKSKHLRSKSTTIAAAACSIKAKLKPDSIVLYSATHSYLNYPSWCWVSTRKPQQCTLRMDYTNYPLACKCCIIHVKSDLYSRGFIVAFVSLLGLVIVPREDLSCDPAIVFLLIEIVSRVEFSCQN